MDQRGKEATDAAGQLMGAALDRPVRLQQAGHQQGIAPARLLDQRQQARVQQLDVGVQQRGDLVLGSLHPRVVRWAEARVVGQRDDLRAAFARQRRAPVPRAGVDDHHLGSFGEVAVQRVHQRPELGFGVVDDHHRGEAHDPAASAKTS